MLRTGLATAIVASGLILGIGSNAQAQGLVLCAQEGGFCRVPYPTRVIYGVPGRSVELFVQRGGVACSNSVFGDPAYGVPKRCAFVARRYGRGPGRWDDRDRGPPPWKYGHRDYDAYGRPYPTYYRTY